MASKTGYIISAVVVVVLAFVVTIYGLDWWSGPSQPPPAAQNPPPPAAENPPTTTSSPTPLNTPSPQASALKDLPAVPGLAWQGIQGLNAQVMSGTPVAAGFPILQLITLPTSGSHNLAGQFTGLKKGQVYRLTASIKSLAGGNFQIEAADGGGPGAAYGVGLFDLVHQKVVSAGGVAKAGMSQGPEGWEQVWIDLTTSSGQFLVNLYVIKDGASSYAGDGKLGVVLGDLSAQPL